MKQLLLILSLSLVACSDQPRLTENPAVDPPSLVPGTDLALPETSDVKNPEATRAYPVGRYEDASDPNVLHEAHTIYRTEQPSTWNLNSTVPTVVPLGPTVSINNPAKDSKRIEGELEQKVQQQNQLLQATYEQNQVLTDELKKFKEEILKAHDIVTVNEALQKQVAELKINLTLVQQELKQRNSVPNAAPKASEDSWWSYWFPTPKPNNNTKGK